MSMYHPIALHWTDAILFDEVITFHIREHSIPVTAIAALAQNSSASLRRSIIVTKSSLKKKRTVAVISTNFRGCNGIKEFENCSLTHVMILKGWPALHLPSLPYPSYFLLPASSPSPPPLAHSAFAELGLALAGFRRPLSAKRTCTYQTSSLMACGMKGWPA